MNIEKTYLHAWTDSMVVLSWLKSHPSRWKVFVANRVSEIISYLDSHHWSHVTTKHNPADAASRGQRQSELVENLMWFQGPHYLHEKEITYKKPQDVDTYAEEEKTNTHHLTTTLIPLERFSSLTRMIRVVAYCLRFVQNLKRKGSERQSGF